MPQKVINEGFSHINLQVEPFVEHEVIDDGVKKTLARLLGWFPSGESWKQLLSDADGRLLVTSGASKTDTGNSSQVTVGVADITLLAANPSRRSYAIKNTGGNTIYLGFNTAAVVATGYPVLANQEFSDDSFTGTLHAISTIAGNDIRIIEF